MTEILLIVGIILLVTAILMLAVLLRRVGRSGVSPVLARFETLEKFQERTEGRADEEREPVGRIAGARSFGNVEKVSGGGRAQRERGDWPQPPGDCRTSTRAARGGP